MVFGRQAIEEGKYTYTRPPLSQTFSSRLPVLLAHTLFAVVCFFACLLVLVCVCLFACLLVCVVWRSSVSRTFSRHRLTIQHIIDTLCALSDRQQSLLVRVGLSFSHPARCCFFREAIEDASDLLLLGLLLPSKGHRASRGGRPNTRGVLQGSQKRTQTGASGHSRPALCGDQTAGHLLQEQGNLDLVFEDGIPGLTSLSPFATDRRRISIPATCSFSSTISGPHFIHMVLVLER